MIQVFADTHYWIAIVDTHDRWNAVARDVKLRMGTASLVTTDEILTEVLNAFCARGVYLRRLACALVHNLRRESSVRVLPQSRATFDSGLILYDARHDKGFSLVDCISMTTMRRIGITDVLTNDEHFAQEGFNVLLK
ncbi:MAG TPA: PIN domain-containing protein [Planctomycetota bacterium]|jgi:predicted nucleic acid-binding protein